MNHYRYMSTTSPKVLPFESVPNPIQPPGAGWDLMGQCALECNGVYRIVWSWRQLAFVTPLAEPEEPGTT
jgi:hypothetical protein